jgi:hypothetical protein
MSVTATGLVKSSSCPAWLRMVPVSRRSASMYSVAPSLAAGQQGPRVREHDRVVVHVHHPALRRDRLSDLVRVAGRRDAGPDVEELADLRLGGEVADSAAEERPVCLRGEGHLRVDLEHRLGRRPVSGVIVLAAQHVVVYPGLVRPAGVERQRPHAVGSCCLVAAHLHALRGFPPGMLAAFADLPAQFIPDYEASFHRRRPGCPCGRPRGPPGSVRIRRFCSLPGKCALGQSPGTLRLLPVG